LDIQYDCSGEYHRRSSSSPRNLRQRLKPMHHQGRVGDRRREVNKLSWTVHRRIAVKGRRLRRRTIEAGGVNVGSWR
jgi:hypothetical protein